MLFALWANCGCWDIRMQQHPLFIKLRLSVNSNESLNVHIIQILLIELLYHSYLFFSYTILLPSYTEATERCRVFQAKPVFQSVNPLACTECGDSLQFSGASSTPPCHTLFPATPLRRPFFHPPSLHPAICFLVYLLVLLFPNSNTILFWEFCFLPFSVHVQTIVIYAAVLSLL